MSNRSSRAFLPTLLLSILGAVLASSAGCRTPEPVAAEPAAVDTAVQVDALHIGPVSDPSNRIGLRTPARDDEQAELAHLLHQGLSLKKVSRLAEAKPVLEACIALAEKLDDRETQATALLELGATHYLLADYTTGKDFMERARVLCREIGDGAGEARALGGLGLCALSLGKNDEAERYLDQAVACAREAASAQEQARALLHLASLHSNRGRFRKAIETYETALALSRPLENRTNEATALQNLGALYHTLSEYARSREYLQEALSVYRELGNRLMIASTLGNLGSVYQALGDYARSRDYHAQHLAIARELGNQNAEAHALLSLGVISALRGQYAEGGNHYRQALELTRRLENRRLEAEVLARLANLHFARGEYEEARQHHARILALAEELSKHQLVADTYGRIADVYFQTGDHTQAIEYYEKQRDLSERLEYPMGVASAVGGLGMVYTKLGDLPRAREFLERDLALAQERGDMAGESFALGNLGNLYVSLGEYVVAKDLHLKQLDLAEKLGNPRARGHALGSLGIVAYELRDLARSKDFSEQALSLFRKLGDRHGEANALGNLGLVHLELGEYATAQQYLEDQLSLARDLDDRVREAYALTILGSTHYMLKRDSEALACAEEGVAIFEQYGIADGIAHALMVVAQAAIQSGDAARALTALKDADLVFERPAVRTLQVSEVSALRSRYSRWGKVFLDLTALRVAQAQTDLEKRTAVTEGLALAGRWKGRALLEGIAEQRRGARSPEALEVRDERRETLAQRNELLAQTSRALRDEKPWAEVERLRAEAQRLDERASALAAELREISPRDAGLELPLTADPEQLRSALGSKTAFIEYGEGEQRLYAFVITDTTLHFLDLGKHASARESVDRHLQSMAAVGRREDPPAHSTTGADLFDRLLAPVLEVAGEETERLVIVPSASLAKLSFESLRWTASGADDLEFVADRYQVSYAPSSAVLVELLGDERVSAGNKMLVLADPVYPSEQPAGTADAGIAIAMARAVPEPGRFVRLVHAQAEGLAIARLMVNTENTADHMALSELSQGRGGSFHGRRVDLHLGAAAAAARLAGDLKPYSILHLAAHGYIDRDSPRKTGIALAFSEDSDGYLSIAQVLDLDLDASLVVLSACDTARGRSREGEGVESLAWAFLYAGARSVVASLWQVDDVSTAILMEELYKNLLEKKLPKGVALREAKQTLRTMTWKQARARLKLPEEELSAYAQARGLAGSGMALKGKLEETYPYAHPYYWAAFILIGDPN